MIRKISIALLGFVVAHHAIAEQQSNIQPSKNASPLKVERTVSSANTEPPDIDVHSLYSKSYALLIGNSQYQSWNDLTSIPDELNQLEAFLKTQGFEIIRKNNLASDELKRTLHSFLIDYGDAPDHRLLVFFGGHGHTLKTWDNGNRGYIVPTDAPNTALDEKGFKKAAVGLEEIKLWTQDSKSHHILFLFDSCFSGSILSGSRYRGAVKADKAKIEASAKNPVRYVITAGKANEKVPGKSKFVPTLINGIRNGDADGYPDGYVKSSELANYLEREIPNQTEDKNHPQSGELDDSFGESGEFIFTVDNKNLQYSANEDDIESFLNDDARNRLLDTSAEDRKINELFNIKNKKCNRPDDNWLHLQKSGYTSAQALLNGCTLSKKDFEEALKSANLGVVTAYLKLGQMYLHGWAVQEDKNTALEWFHKAAKQGNSIGQLMLARIYLKIDEKKALKWFRKAAEQGDASGQYAQGLISLSRNQNEKEALAWFRKAAAQGDKRAKKMVAELEAKGIK
jgi:hypothetical protein